MPDELRALPCDRCRAQALQSRRRAGPAPVAGSERRARWRRRRASLSRSHAPSLSELVDGIAADGHGLVMLMGKGGVGKTTLAAAVAVELAHRGLPVHLTTSDPAAHLAETLHGRWNI